MPLLSDPLVITVPQAVIPLLLVAITFVIIKALLKTIFP